MVLIARIALLLAATGAVACGYCDSYTAPVTFRVDGDCGAPGIVVIEDRGSVYSDALYAHNGGPTLGVSGGYYDRTSCPYRPLDGFTLQGMDRTCNAVRDGAGVTVLCELHDGGTCRAHLTPVQD